MDIEKLIEQLNDFNENHISVLCGSGQCACGYLCDKDDCIVVRAATALSTLQDENEEMQKQLNMFSEFLCYMTGGLLSKTNYTAQEMVTAAEDYQQKVCGECDLRDENEKLRAELERVKRERGAAIADWQGFCAKCVWNGKQYLSDGKMDDRCKTCRDNNKCNWEWRGIKED